MVEPYSSPGESGFRAVGGASLRTPGWEPPPVRLPFPSAASSQPCSPVGAAFGAAAEVPLPAAALSPPCLPIRSPSSPANGFTHCSRSAHRSQGEQLKEGAHRPRVGLRRLRALKSRGLPPLPIRTLARLKGALHLAGRQPCWELHVLRWPSCPWERNERCSPPACGLGRLESINILSTRMFMVEEGDAWSWKKDLPVENIGVFHLS